MEVLWEGSDVGAQGLKVQYFDRSVFQLQLFFYTIHHPYTDRIVMFLITKMNRRFITLHLKMRNCDCC